VAVAQRTYARSLFEAAGERNQLERVHEDLTDFAAMVEEVPELQALLENPELDRREKASLLEQLLGDVDELVRNFLQILVEKGRIGELVEISREFEALVAEAQGILDVDVTTAVELSEQEFNDLVHRIGKASGRQVRASRAVDPDLVGGLVLQIGSRRLDASIRGRLNRLRQELTTLRSGRDSGLSAQRTSGGGLGEPGGSPS
jgi:F-type H+-transporting ATPase subunit delta